jgi:hypothetical protein
VYEYCTLGDFERDFERDFATTTRMSKKRRMTADTSLNDNDDKEYSDNVNCSGDADNGAAGKLSFWPLLQMLKRYDSVCY